MHVYLQDVTMWKLYGWPLLAIALGYIFCIDEHYCGIMDFCCLPAHLVHLARICRDIAERCEGYIQYVLTSVLGCLPSEACYAIRRVTDFETRVG